MSDKSVKRKRDSIAIDKELKIVLRECLSDNIEISVRAVVKKMTLLDSPSSITRNSVRMSLVNNAKETQKQTRTTAARIAKGSVKSDKDKIIALEQQLTASIEREKNLHACVLALINAAAVQGVNWVELYEKYDLELNSDPNG